MSNTTLPVSVIRLEAGVRRLVVDQLHARLALAVLGRAREDRVLPRNRGRGLVQVDLVVRDCLRSTYISTFGPMSELPIPSAGPGPKCDNPSAWPSSWTVLEEVRRVETDLEAEVRPNLTGNQIVIDDRRAAVAGTPCSGPIAKPLRSVADIDEGPKDVPLARQPQLPLGFFNRLMIALGLFINPVDAGPSPVT